MEITLKQHASLFELNLARVKRWARTFLGSDPAAGMQMGYERKLTLNDAFMLYLGGLFVSGLQIPVGEVPKLLQDLKPWLETKGLLPDTDIFEGGDSWSRWSIEIMRGEPYVCNGIITFSESFVNWEGRNVFRKYYQIEQITKLKLKELTRTAPFQVKAFCAISEVLHFFMTTVIGLDAWQKWCDARTK